MLRMVTHAYRVASKQQLLYPKCPSGFTQQLQKHVGQPHWMSCTWQKNHKHMEPLGNREEPKEMQQNWGGGEGSQTEKGTKEKGERGKVIGGQIKGQGSLGKW